MTAALFAGWLTSQGDTETISHNRTLIPSSVANKPSYRKLHKYGKLITFFVFLYTTITRTTESLQIITGSELQGIKTQTQIVE